MNSELKFLISTLSEHSISEDQVSNLISDFEELQDSEKKLSKMVKDDTKLVLIDVLVSKYNEVRNRLEDLVEKPDLYVKKKNELRAAKLRFNESLTNHPVGMERLKDALPIFFGGTANATCSK